MPGLNRQQLDQFRTYGFVMVESVFDPERLLDPLVAEYETVLDKLAQELFSTGKISSTYPELPFEPRLIKIYQETGKVHSQFFDMSLPQKGIRHDTPMWQGPAVFNILTAPEILDVAESILGGELFSNPVQHVRIKPPERLTPIDPQTGRPQLDATPWHQDSGVITADADESEILTVWLPVWDADERAGCLQVIPGSHGGDILTHCPGTDLTSPAGLQIPAKLLEMGKATALPMKRGSVLFMHRRTCHSSLPNKSDHIRWSLDLRYNPIGQATGREAFPGFVARSRTSPGSELRDQVKWARLWQDARKRIADAALMPAFNRWSGDDPVCA